MPNQPSQSLALYRAIIKNMVEQVLLAQNRCNCKKDAKLFEPQSVWIFPGWVYFSPMVNTKNSEITETNIYKVLILLYFIFLFNHGKNLSRPH